MGQQREHEKPNGWFERHVIEALAALHSELSQLEAQLSEVNEQFRQRELIVERRLTVVEERTSRKAKLWSAVGSVVAILIAVLIEALTR